MGTHKSLGYSLPVTLGAFVRELLAIVLVLILNQRAWGFDYFSPGLILFLVLVTMRVPYINSFALLFEAVSMGKWVEKHRVGLQRHRGKAQNLVHILAILAAHAGGSVGAAALRVYLDVAFGKEVSSLPDPALEVSIAELRQLDPFWGADQRLARLAAYGNRTLISTLPLSAHTDLGIDRLALIAWYAGEEAGFVCLLCVCFVHIWLSAGVGEDARRKQAANPFVKEYWSRLLRACTLLAVVYMALYRAFPSAHGSLHVTIFRCQYQAWNPSVRLVDYDNNEPVVRIVGGVVGLVLAHIYNCAVAATETREEDSDDFMFKLVWGFERPERQEAEGWSQKRRRADADPDEVEVLLRRAPAMRIMPGFDR